MKLVKLIVSLLVISGLIWIYPKGSPEINEENLKKIESIYDERKSKEIIDKLTKIN